jgi:hypothetical protein
MDLAGYDKYFAGELSDYSLPDEELKSFLDALKDLPKPEIRKTGRW